MALDAWALRPFVQLVCSNAQQTGRFTFTGNAADNSQFSGKAFCYGVEIVEGYLAFTPEGLLHWLYGRCTRRELVAAAYQDPAKVSKYQQRKSLLQEMLTYLHHAHYEEYENASSMLHMVNDLSSDEDFPNCPNGPPGEHVTGMMAAAAAAAASATLAGCDNGPAVDGSGLTVSVPRLALTTWTVLCMLYSRSPWHDMNYVEKPPVTALAATELQPTEEVQPALDW